MQQFTQKYQLSQHIHSKALMFILASRTDFNSSSMHIYSKTLIFLGEAIFLLPIRQEKANNSYNLASPLVLHNAHQHTTNAGSHLYGGALDIGYSIK